MRKLPNWLIAAFISVAFGVLFGIGIVASSLIFQPERITNDPFGFWLSVALKVFVQITAFNLAYFIYIMAQKGDGDSKLSRAFKPYARFVSYVYQKSMQAIVRARIKVVNRERFIETSNTLLERITESLHYDDLFVKDDKNIVKPVDIKKLVDEKATAYELTKKEVKRLRKNIVNIINGRKVKYEKVEYDVLMIGADKVKNGYVSMSVSESGMLLYKNATMVIMSCVLAIITSIFILGQINGDILYEILSSLFTIIVAVLSAIVYGVLVVSKLIRAYSARRDFFNDFIEMPEEVKTI